MKPAFFVLFLMALIPTAHGKAAFFNYPEMIRRSDVVALIEVTAVAPASMKGDHWTYGQKVSAKSLQVFKGDLDKDITLYGQEDFICARCDFSKGRQLVFLKRDKDLLTGSNWQFSIRPVINDQVEWFKNPNSLNFSPMNLATVLQEVKTEIAAQARTP